uniref:Uncharacterized protein n=1 Tax=Chenopodium quinoa TaxID=63459 RepID=A0A803KS01_CHEQI
MFYLFCWDKPTTINNAVVGNPNSSNNNVVENTEGDIEMGLETRKDLLLKALGEEGVDSDIVRLAGHPRFLFTIKEETTEDLESEDGKSKASKKGSRTRSLSDLIMAIETHTPYNNLSPMSSSSPKSKLLLSTNNNNYNNPLFETSATVVEAEINRLRSSPPPKFKFLRDAEEKLYRRLVEEAQKSGIFQEVVLDNSLPSNYHSDEEEEKEIHCTSQKIADEAPPNCVPLPPRFTIAGNQYKLGKQNGEEGLCHNNDEKCVRQKQLLGTCMEAQAGKNKKPWGSINYHLQRLNRGRK